MYPVQFNYEFAKGQAATGNQSLVDPTLLTGSDARPEYLFSVGSI